MRGSEIIVVGTSQSVAPLAIRERMHVELEAVHEALAELVGDRDAMDEAVPLSTCGRFELYVVADTAERPLRLLTALLSRRTGLPRHELRRYLYALRGPTAVRHLLRVAAGLDSVVHGEAQILGQVRQAALDPRASQKGPVLHRLFEVAIATGKKVRTETEIGRGAASLASAALEMVGGELGSLHGVSAMVVGAGDTGALVARLLRKRGVGRLIVANRTETTAHEVAAGLGGEGMGIDEIPGRLAEVDLVVGAVTAEQYVLDLARLREGGWTGARGRLHLLDLAHPRNFDPALADEPGVRLHDLDHVFERVEAARATRALQIPQAEGIVREQADAFVGWLRSRQSVHVLRSVRERVLEIAREEAEHFAQGRSDEERERMHRLARSVARTLLHHPTLALREADPESPEGQFLIEHVPALFGVEQVRNGHPEPAEDPA